ncbi:MAG TPA: hypothetical protein VJB12_00440 [Candidatus Nanoarchaeia archaeon]|nr:hypothetical protein [Candidatus Nanoarchaeia archaeon]
MPYKWRISNNELCSYIMANSGAATGFASSSGASSGGSSGASSGETNDI